MGCTKSVQIVDPRYLNHPKKRSEIKTQEQQNNRHSNNNNQFSNLVQAEFQIQQIEFLKENEQQIKDKQILKKFKLNYKQLEYEETDFQIFNFSFQQSQIILIYNQLFNKETSGRYNNQLPLQHYNCGALAYINNKGVVNCQNKCYSYHIGQAIIKSNRNRIDRFYKQKSYTSDYNQIRSQIELSQIIVDSLRCSNKTESEKENFTKSFSQVIVNFFINRMVDQ